MIPINFFPSRKMASIFLSTQSTRAPLVVKRTFASIEEASTTIGGNREGEGGEEEEDG